MKAAEFVTRLAHMATVYPCELASDTHAHAPADGVPTRLCRPQGNDEARWPSQRPRGLAKPQPRQRDTAARWRGRQVCRLRPLADRPRAPTAPGVCPAPARRDIKGPYKRRSAREARPRGLSGKLFYFHRGSAAILSDVFGSRGRYCRRHDRAYRSLAVTSFGNI